MDYSIQYRLWHKGTSEERRNFVEMYHKFYDKFLLKENKKIAIDVGCGTGNFLDYLKELKYKNIYGYDADDSQYKIAKSFYGSNVIKEKSFSKACLKFNVKKFDLISCLDVLEHVKKTEIVPLCADFFSHLQNNGTLLLSVPNANSILSSRWRYIDFTHNILFTPESIYFILRNAGFKKINIFPGEPDNKFPITFTPSIYINYFKKKFVRYLIKLFYLVEEGAETEDLILSNNLFVVAKK